MIRISGLFLQGHSKGVGSFSPSSTSSGVVALLIPTPSGKPPATTPDPPRSGMRIICCRSYTTGSSMDISRGPGDPESRPHPRCSPGCQVCRKFLDPVIAFKHNLLLIFASKNLQKIFKRKISVFSKKSKSLSPDFIPFLLSLTIFSTGFFAFWYLPI